VTGFVIISSPFESKKSELFIGMKGVKILLLIALMMFVTSCHCRNNVRRMLPRDTFLKIEKSLFIKICNPRIPTMCRSKNLGASGSGVIVAHGDEGSYALTAGHICEDNELRRLTHGAAEHRLEFKVLDIEGRMYSVDIVAIDSQHDLCVVYAKDLWQPAIALGVDKPTPGDRVYNIASPLGIFAKQMVPIFEGFYNGDSHDRSFYSLPAKGGSSGSPIINHRGELIGMVSMAFVHFSHIAISPQFESIISFVDASVSRDKTKRSMGSFLDKLKLIFHKKDKKLVKNP